MLTDRQTILLEMLNWFTAYCESNNITYYAAGGTMIGAARHSGFIPWDDDIDLVVPRKDYNRLINSFTKKIDHYVLESPYSGNEDYLYSYSKLYDTRTTLTEKNRKRCKRGLYIDIFPLDGLGNSTDEALQNFKKFDRWNMFLMARTCVISKDRENYKNLAIAVIGSIPGFLVNEKKLSIFLDRIANGINDDNSIYVGNLSGAYRNKEITRREFFGKPALYAFENIKIYGPEKYNEYLTDIYNDWRVLPPEDKRYTKHDYYEFDLNRSYLADE